MPIEVLRDLKTKYNLNWDFGIRQLRDPKSLSLLDGVRDDIAGQNWQQFYSSWDIIGNATRDLLRRIAYQFHCSSDETDTFNELYKIFDAARDYQNECERDLSNDLEIAYEYVARTAAASIDYAPQGRAIVDQPTFKRVIDRNDEKFVVFSDLHMTAHKDTARNFFDRNYRLYLDVLAQYFDSGYVVVENGDVEDCVICEPNESRAKSMRAAADKAKFPIEWNNDWQGFLNTRYEAREEALQDIFDSHKDYYNLVQPHALGGEYIRLCGNHDTYLDDERNLSSMIQDKLGLLVQDVLRIVRTDSAGSEKVRYVVMHGNQFDPVCMQHGDISYAKSLGETYSECQGWAFEGGDRYWTTQDTKKWYNGSVYGNTLASAKAGSYSSNYPSDVGKIAEALGLEVLNFITTLKGLSDAERDLVIGETDNIKANSKGFVETIMEHQIAWEYFENSDGFNALTLEVWRGDEWFKMRHLDEVTLCFYYVQEFLDVSAKNQPMPALLIGHTHEPRLNAVSPENGNEYTFYLNSGSAGRYENLIWCIEIVGNDASLRSWSYVDGKLRASTWKPKRGALYRS
jgi:hypothetical protein